MATRSDITPELCRQLLRYEAETGRFFWRRRQDFYFPNPRVAASWNTRRAGKPAFTSTQSRGYHSGRVLGHMITPHRLAWAMHFGEWPKGEIDHINGDRTDNRIINLRDVERAQNARNKTRYLNNTSGLQGVRLERGRWVAKINVEAGREIRLGSYATFEEAAAARLAAERVVGYHVNHGRAKAPPVPS